MNEHVPYTSDDDRQLGIDFHGAHLTDADVPRLTKQQERVLEALRNERTATVDGIVRRVFLMTGRHDPATSVDRQLRYLREKGLADNEHKGGGLWVWKALSPMCRRIAGVDRV